MSEVGHLQLVLVVGSRTKSTDDTNWIRFSYILVCQNVAILYTINRQIAISTNIEHEERV